MNAPSLPASERGLILLVAIALMVSGVVFHATRERPPAPLDPVPIVVENVFVVRPTFRDSRPIDINAASREDLVRLPGIGDVLAGRIVAHRAERGAYASIDELLDVSGIGPTVLERLRGLVTVGSNEAPDRTDQ